MSNSYICKPIFNPIRSLEPKHILFYYRADCLALERRRSGLTSSYKDTQDADKKIKDVRKQYHTIVRMYILWSNDRFGVNTIIFHYFAK